jgi:hypothetical protein
VAYKGFKVPAAEVTRDGLAFINNKLAKYGQVPATVIAGWTRYPQLNTWQGELLGGNTDATRLTWNDANVGDNTRRAVAEYEAAKAAKPGKKQRGR